MNYSDVYGMEVGDLLQLKVRYINPRTGRVKRGSISQISRTHGIVRNKENYLVHVLWTKIDKEESI